MQEALKEAIQEIGGPTKTAKHLNISAQAVGKWRRTPADKVLRIEKLSGVSRHKLRPDVFGLAPEAPEAAA